MATIPVEFNLETEELVIRETGRRYKITNVDSFYDSIHEFIEEINKDIAEMTTTFSVETRNVNGTEMLCIIIWCDDAIDDSYSQICITICYDIATIVWSGHEIDLDDDNNMVDYCSYAFGYNNEIVLK